MRECKVLQGHMMSDHIHMLIEIVHLRYLPKYSVTQVVGYIKGKSAIYISRGNTVSGRDISLNKIHGYVGILSRWRQKRGDDTKVYSESESRGQENETQ